MIWTIERFALPRSPFTNLSAAAALTALLTLLSCGESGSLGIPAKIDPTLGASRDTTGNGMAFRFKTIKNISYPAGYFAGGREYFWAIQLTITTSSLTGDDLTGKESTGKVSSGKVSSGKESTGEEQAKAKTTYQIAYISDSFATPNQYDLGDILAGGSAGVYQLRTIGDTTSFQLIESAKVAQTSDGFMIDISDSDILRPKLEANPPTGFTVKAEGNLMVRRSFTCSYPNGICGND